MTNYPGGMVVSIIIDQVEMVEETEYDDIVQCDHSYDR